MPRPLSATESEVVLQLEWEGKRIVTIDDIVEILGCSRNYAYQLAHRLEKRSWLERIDAGTYLLIPAERGVEGVPDMNPFIIGRILPSPYYFSYAVANNYYGFSPQMPSVIHIVLAKQKQTITLKNTEFHFVKLKPGKIFGYHEVNVLGEEVFMAEPEKAVVDSLDKPGYAGGIEEVTRVIHRAANKVDMQKLVRYALRMGSRSLVQRLGYLLGTTGTKIPPPLEETMLKEIGRNYAYLGSPRRWGKGGETDSKWQVMVNVPPRRLLGEVGIQ